jgi:uncharacterized protein (TIGR03663 family)
MTISSDSFPKLEERVESVSTSSDSMVKPDGVKPDGIKPDGIEPNGTEANAGDPNGPESESDFAPALELPPWLWRWLWIGACAVIILAGAFLRLYKLGLVPLHHDEGVNGFFLTNLYRDHIYHYDPENYHGPTLYYFALVASYIFGLTTLAIRATTAVFGVGTIWLILTLRQRIGRAGALAAASFIAFSPGAIYFSRYFIHETLFVFFTLGIIVYWFKYKADPWPGYLMVVAIMAGLLFATKETAVINGVALAAAGISSGFYLSLRKWIAKRRARVDEGGLPTDSMTAEQNPPTDRLEPPSNQPPSNKEIDSLAGGLKKKRWRQVLVWGSAVALFLFVMVLMYSSMFTYAHGVKDALRALSFWTQTGKTGHVHRWNAYILWMWEEETPLLVLGGIGVLVSLWLANSRFAVFISLFSVALLAGYSIVPYKTPWLALSVIVPLAITAGCAIDAFYERSKGWEKALCIALIIAPAGFLLRQAIELNFYHYDDDNYAYVYAHTRREVFGLIDQLAEIARRSGKGQDLTITVTTSEYWPLPWYLRNYKNVGFYGQLANRGDMVVIGSTDQDAQLQQLLGNTYIQLGTYTLRPGVDLVLYAQHNM